MNDLDIINGLIDDTIKAMLSGQLDEMDPKEYKKLCKELQESKDKFKHLEK